MIIDFRLRNPRRLKLDFDDEIPSFLRQEFEYRYMGRVSLAFPEDITTRIQMSLYKRRYYMLTRRYTFLDFLPFVF
jgi:hypothetical protein